MIRKIINIDLEKCNGCGLCIPNCPEGALQIIDNKARLISDLFCDGLGACLGHCPEGAIEVIEREAEPYDEYKVMDIIAAQGRNTILAHLEHLRDHQEYEFLKLAVKYIKDHNIDMSPEEEQQPQQTYPEITFPSLGEAMKHSGHGSSCGCSGGKTIDFKIDMQQVEESVHKAVPVISAEEMTADTPSELRQWPVQMHLLNPMASYFQNADVVFAADCVAFSMGNFHQKFLKNRALAIACPKLDSNKDVYIEKLTTMFGNSNIKSLIVPVMEVPCCSGMIQMAKIAREKAGSDLPIQKIVIGIQGDILSEETV